MQTLKPANRILISNKYRALLDCQGQRYSCGSKDIILLRLLFVTFRRNNFKTHFLNYSLIEINHRNVSTDAINDINFELEEMFGLLKDNK